MANKAYDDSPRIKFHNSDPSPLWRIGRHVTHGLGLASPVRGNGFAPKPPLLPRYTRGNQSVEQELRYFDIIFFINHCGITSGIKLLLAGIAHPSNSIPYYHQFSCLVL